MCMLDAWEIFARVTGLVPWCIAFFDLTLQNSCSMLGFAGAALAISKSNASFTTGWITHTGWITQNQDT